MSALGGSLLASLGKQVKSVTEISKGFVDDLAGLVGDDKPDQATAAASVEAPPMHLHGASQQA